MFHAAFFWGWGASFGGGAAANVGKPGATATVVGGVPWAGPSCRLWWRGPRRVWRCSPLSPPPCTWRGATARPVVGAVEGGWRPVRGSGDGRGRGRLFAGGCGRLLSGGGFAGLETYETVPPLCGAAAPTGRGAVRCVSRLFFFWSCALQLVRCGHPLGRRRVRGGLGRGRRVRRVAASTCNSPLHCLCFTPLRVGDRAARADFSRHRQPGYQRHRHRHVHFRRCRPAAGSDAASGKRHTWGAGGSVDAVPRPGRVPLRTLRPPNGKTFLHN